MLTVPYADTYTQHSRNAVPFKWLAIESLQTQTFSSASDVWAFGVTMWEVMTLGESPYPGVENREVLILLIGGNRLAQPANCPDSVYRLMRTCWETDPEDRPVSVHI